MRWHYRKRPDTVTRVRQIPVSGVQSDPNSQRVLPTSCHTRSLVEDT